MLERSNDGKNRQHKAMTASRPFPGGDGISQRCRRKHFSALAREAFLITESLEASTVLLAFRSAVAGSISHRQEGREASAYAGISQRCHRKHFASSKWTGSISICWHFAALSPEAFRIVKVDGKHFASSKWTGSISICWHFTAWRRKHFTSSLWTGSISICWEGYF